MEQLKTQDMVYVHNTMRDAFERAAMLDNMDLNNIEQRDAVILYFDAMLSFIQSHHEAEDFVLWPNLLERAEADADIIRHGMNQHEELADLLPAAQKALVALRQDPNITALTELKTTLVEMGAMLTQHLNDEENNVLPICAQHITQDEWAQLPQHTLQKLEGPVLMMVIGLVRHAFDDTYRAAMDANMPPPLKQAWQSEGQALFDQTMARMNLELVA